MELIDRERLISEKSWDAPIKDYVTGDIQCVQVVDVGDIEEFPAVDAVEVVRCKDCEWMLYESENWKEYPEQEWCDYYDCETNINGFCYRAERKEVKDAID